ncbi:MAG: hypothetical protein KAH32_05520 [Chlamydiia bacterium]|nr:hypothetical protein [Chlamydiia bacterium]
MTQIKIRRITFDEIKEFEALDVNRLPEEQDTVWSIIFDPVADKFTMAKLYNGYEMTIVKSILTKNFETRTDDLSVDRGFVFKKNWDLDDVVDALTFPVSGPTLSIVSSVMLAEISVSTPVSLSSTYTKNGGGDLVAGSEEYYVDGVSLGGGGRTFNLQKTTETSTTVSVNVDIDISSDPKYDMTTMSTYTKILTIHPSFHGFKSPNGSGSFNPIVETDFTRKQLDDIARTKDTIFNFTNIGGSGALYYWFAVGGIHTPISWVEIDSAGVEDGINQGAIDTLFNKQAVDITYLGNTFKVFVVKQPTEFINRIKIKF